MDLSERIAEVIATIPHASDIHIQAGKPLKHRTPAGVLDDGRGAVGDDEIVALADRIAPGGWRDRIEHGGGHIDFSAQIGTARLRCNLFRYGGLGRLALAMRRLADTVPPLDSLGLPQAAQALADRACGLVLVTGPTGSGKSTTLAAMIGRINERRPCHIITIEDPIEYVHRDGMATIAQREIGADASSFERGLIAAMREDPDVILIGEIRNKATMETALQAAETGHLVLATLHTSSAATTVERVTDFFHQEEKILARSVLASVLAGVVAQTLVPSRDGTRRWLASEVLINNSAVAGVIREGKTHQIPNLILSSRSDGMRLMNASLEELVAGGAITADAAIAASYDPAQLAKALKR